MQASDYNRRVERVGTDLSGILVKVRAIDTKLNTKILIAIGVGVFGVLLAVLSFFIH